MGFPEDGYSLRYVLECAMQDMYTSIYQYCMILDKKAGPRPQLALRFRFSSSHSTSLFGQPPRNSTYGCTDVPYIIHIQSHIQSFQNIH